MKVGLDKPNLNKNLSFEGYKPVKSNYGGKEYEFNYVYDSDNEDCYLEIFLVEKDINGNFIVTGEKDNFGNVKPLVNFNNGDWCIKLKSGKATRVDLAGDYGLAPDQPFAYHYAIRPKNMPDGTPEYKIDPGNIVNTGANKAHEVYNIVSGRSSTSTNGGTMKLIVPDFNNVMWVYDNDNKIVKNPDIEKARKTNKNFANKIGGSLAGIEKNLDDDDLDNFSKIITTPLFADDSLSAHGYWNKNCFQMAHSLGNINNYMSLQRKMFAKGINLVSDGAYVNEGLEGVHFRHILQWGKKSPYFNWFRISGLQDSPLSLGVFGKKLEHITHRVVNSKYDFEQQLDGSIKITKSKTYKSNKPTYIQIYDDRLVNADKLDSQELIKSYDKLPNNNLDINNHNDTVVPYHFQINPETYKKNVELLSDYNKSVRENIKKIDLKSGKGTRAVTQFEYFGVDHKHENGFETWDANPDIAKLSYVMSHNETQNLKNISDPELRAAQKKFLHRKNMEVQDYAVTSAQYWTKKTNQILTLYVAQHLQNLNEKNSEEIFNTIKELSNGKILPKNIDVNEQIVKNILKHRYKLQGNDTEEQYDRAILQGLMNLPLDSIEVGDDIISVLASPLVSKRATKENQIGVSRYDMYIRGNLHLTPENKEVYKASDRLYEKEMSIFAKNILKEVENSLPKEQKLHDASGNTTEYGKYVIPLLTAEIARFAIIKAVTPDTGFKYNKQTGEISYDYDKTKNTSLLQMGIIADSPEDEAKSLISKLRHNINKISKKDKDALKDALVKSIKGTNYESFALADMIVSRTQSGLDWRIDATKDIADIDSLRNGKTNFEYTWDQVIKFWSKFTDGVKKYHPDAYIAAEITDEEGLYDIGNGYLSGSRYSDKKEIDKKLINESGFTTFANYTYLSSNITQIFGKLFDYDGENSPDKGLVHGDAVYNQLAGGGNFFGSVPLESIIYSYNFSGNHDKCRTLEGYAVDMDMVYTDLTNHKNYDYRQRAYKILHGMGYGNNPNPDSVNGYDYSRVSNLAIAKCESISSGMGKAAFKIDLSDDRAKYIYNLMFKALKNISNGKFKGKIFEANGFGTKDFNTAIDIVLEEMDFVEPNSSARLSDKEKKKLKDKTLEFIIDPAMSKLLGQMKFLVALTGNPTLFAGDEYGATGYETTTKNIYLQNRNIIREDWADENSPEYKKFVATHKKNIEHQLSLRKRPELQALNDGTPYMLDVHSADYTKPIYENNFEDKVKYYENGQTKISILLRQSPNGSMTVSLFNTEGLTHKFDEYYRPAEIRLNEIGLGSGRKEKEKTIQGLKNGIIFYDASEIDKPDREKTVYKVIDGKIRRADGQQIKFKDSTMILYSKPNTVTFTGKRVMYNPQYNFVSNLYTNVKKAELGSKFEIVAR